MKISWAGQSCFKIVVSKGRKKVKVVIDPFKKKIGLKPPSFSGDILLITHPHYDHNNKKAVKGKPFVIESPGEYEVKGVFVRGISSFHDNKKGKERGKNTIYTIRAEGMNLCHLGDLGQEELTDKQVEKIGNIDVLMVPVGGKYTVSGHQAKEIISQIDPKVVIPMHYKIPGLKLDLEGLNKFLKAMGQKSINKKSYFSIKKSKLPKEEMKVVALKA